MNTPEQKFKISPPSMLLCAILFNTMGYLHELLKKERTDV